MYGNPRYVKRSQTPQGQLSKGQRLHKVGRLARRFFHSNRLCSNFLDQS